MTPGRLAWKLHQSHYLGTVFEDLTSIDAQQDTFQGEECWLKQGVLKHLMELSVCIGKSSHNITIMPVKGRQYNKFSHHRAIFSPSSFSIKDSHVAIGDWIADDWYVGKIKQISTIPFGPSFKAYFVRQRFKEFLVQEAQQEPYCQYPLVGGCPYHPELEDAIEVVMAQGIIAHFAYNPHDEQAFGLPCFHALPLNKVPPMPYHTMKSTNFVRIEYKKCYLSTVPYLSVLFCAIAWQHLMVFKKIQ